MLEETKRMCQIICPKCQLTMIGPDTDPTFGTRCPRCAAATVRFPGQLKLDANRVWVSESKKGKVHLLRHTLPIKATELGAVLQSKAWCGLSNVGRWIVADEFIVGNADRLVCPGCLAGYLVNQGFRPSAETL